METPSPTDLRAFAVSLVDALAQWDPLDAAQAAQAQSKQAFVDALTEISALAAGDPLAMEVRRLVVDSESTTADTEAAGEQDTEATHKGRHLAHLVAALTHRDVLLKCKVANAVGSLCTSRVAGQRLLELHGTALVAGLARMATSKNTWAQADAFFVFGWVVVVGEDALVAQELVRFIPIAIKLLTKNLQTHTTTGTLDEQDANLRIYGLVFLLNFSQREATALEPQLVGLLEMLQLLITRLLETTAVLLNGTESDKQEHDNVGEHVEFVRLAVTLLNAVVDQLDTAPATIIALKMLPHLLKLEQTLHSDALEKRIREAREGERSEDDEGEDEEEDEINELDELRERMRCIKETVLAHR